MAGLANMLFYEFGLRVYECYYHSDPDKNHAIISQDVLFETSPENEKTGKTQFCPAVGINPTYHAKNLLLNFEGIKTDKEARKVIEKPIETNYEIPPSRITQIHFKLRSHKNHQDGSTRKRVLKRDTNQKDALINTVIDHVIMSR